MATIADKICSFYDHLFIDVILPNGYKFLNPFQENPETRLVMHQFYQRFYSDNQSRKFLIGINPSRHGAGVTGVPFTDTKRLKLACGIEMKNVHTHEVSSVFFYNMIEAYGGVDLFYKDVFVNSPFPLALVRETKNGWLNVNYYDDKMLFESLKSVMIETLREFISWGLLTDEVYVMGKKNALFIQKLNEKEKLVGKITVLEHPRYIQQYKSKSAILYLDKYLIALKKSPRKLLSEDLFM